MPIPLFVITVFFTAVESSLRFLDFIFLWSSRFYWFVIQNIVLIDKPFSVNFLASYAVISNKLINRLKTFIHKLGRFFLRYPFR